MYSPIVNYHRYKLIVEYNGMAFEAGWQFQPNKTSVQGALKEAVYKTVQEDARIYGAGRTDKDVHALGQVVHIDLVRKHTLQRLLNGLNFYMRDTGCRVRSVEHVDSDFHARFSSKSKLYRYCICHDKICSIFDVGRCWHIHSAVQINLDHMIEQSKYLLGEHDFTSFRDIACQAPNPVRCIDFIDINTHDNKIYFEFRAQSFLHKQVRIMVGTLIDIGRGHLRDIESILHAKDRKCAGQTAPGCGLYLVEIGYS